jgi:S-(hydroxymethyl)glutathione dehydrogenase/alcohol dehydrogenase
MIVGVDINAARESVARELGLTHVVDASKPDATKQVMELTRGGGDVVFESVGNVKVMRQALECCRAGWGTCVILGLEHGTEEISFRPVLVRYGRVLKGSYFGGIKGRSGLPRLADWYMDKRIKVDELITHTLPLERINEAFDLMRRGESIRTVVTF